MKGRNSIRSSGPDSAPIYPERAKATRGDIASHPQHLIVALVAAFADLAMQKIPTTDPSVRSILLPLDAR